MINYLVEKEYQGLVDAYEKIGGDKSTLLNNDIASLIVHENKVLSANTIEGVKLTGESKPSCSPVFWDFTPGRFTGDRIAGRCQEGGRGQSNCSLHFPQCGSYNPQDGCGDKY